MDLAGVPILAQLANLLQIRGATLSMGLIVTSEWLSPQLAKRKRLFTVTLLKC